MFRKGLRATGQARLARRTENRRKSRDRPSDDHLDGQERKGRQGAKHGFPFTIAPVASQGEGDGTEIGGTVAQGGRDPGEERGDCLAVVAVAITESFRQRFIFGDDGRPVDEEEERDEEEAGPEGCRSQPPPEANDEGAQVERIAGEGIGSGRGQIAILGKDARRPSADCQPNQNDRPPGQERLRGRFGQPPGRDAKDPARAQTGLAVGRSQRSGTPDGVPGTTDSRNISSVG